MILHHGTANILQCLVFRYYGISLFTIVGTDRAQVQPIINYLVLNDIFAILHIWINIYIVAFINCNLFYVVTVNFSQSTYSVNENDGKVQLELVLNNALATSMMVRVLTTNGSAIGKCIIYANCK